jgi:hypothetical protein
MSLFTENSQNLRNRAITFVQGEKALSYCFLKKKLMSLVSEDCDTCRFLWKTAVDRKCQGAQYDWPVAVFYMPL